MSWMLGGTPPDMDPATLRRLEQPKAPADVIPITVDFSGALNAIDCDKLVVSQPTISVVRNDGIASDLIWVPPASFNTDGTRLTMWVAGGTAAREYLVSITVLSADGQTLVRSYIIPVYFR